MDASGYLPFLLQAAAGAAELALLCWWTKRVDTQEALRRADLAGGLTLAAAMMAALLWSDLGILVDMACGLTIWFVVMLAHRRIVFRASKRLHGFDLGLDAYTKVVAKWIGVQFALMGIQFLLVGFFAAGALRLALSREWRELYLFAAAVAAAVAVYPLAIVIGDAINARLSRHLASGLMPAADLLHPPRESLKIRWLEYAFSLTAGSILYLAARDIWLDLTFAAGFAGFLGLYLAVVLRDRLAPRTRRIAAGVIMLPLAFALWRVLTVVVPAERLAAAVVEGNAAVAGALVAAGVDPNHTDGMSGMNAMTAAIYAENPAALRALLLAGGDPNQRNRKGYTPLAQAATTGNAEMTTMLLAAGARVHDSGSPSMSPLGIAAFKGRAEAARVLIAAGASVAGLPKQARPLIQAANHDQAELVRLLLEAGAPIDGRDGRGAAALHAAAESGALQAAAALLKAGADRGGRDRRGRTAADYAAHAGTNKDEMLALLNRAPATRRGKP